ncbi:beta transducin-like protein HET-E4s, partial [Paraphaeosphaeria sporulosa]
NFAPIATLAPEYLGVPNVNGLLRGDYEINSPDAEVDSPVLAITDEQLHEMRRSGQKLPARVSWVLVPTRPGRKIDDTFEVFQSQCKRWDTTIEYQQYTQSSGNSKEEDDLTGFMLLEDFFARVTERGQHTELQRIEAEGKDPVNVLSLSAEITGSAFREPEAITTLRYRLLSVLSKRSIGHSTETGVGKLSVQPVRLVDQEACLKFLLPRLSLVRKLFEKEVPPWISTKLPMTENWSACLQTLEGHSDTVTSVAFSPDSTRLASASTDGTVKVWDAGSGACLQTLDIGYPLQTMSFNASGSGLLTNIGVINLGPLLSSNITTTTQELESPKYQVTALSSDGTWITYNSQNVIWLPLEYRPRCSAVSESLIGIGVGTGRVWICDVKPHDR